MEESLLSSEKHTPQNINPNAENAAIDHFLFILSIMDIREAFYLRLRSDGDCHSSGCEEPERSVRLDSCYQYPAIAQERPSISSEERPVNDSDEDMDILEILDHLWVGYSRP